MAKQYLDAESNPYFVVLRSSDGTYQSSWSSAYSMKFQGDYAVLIGHNNAEMGLKIKFDEIDWGACLPIPDPLPTDAEGYMAYLNFIFNGQMGTLVPTPTPQTMIYNTTPIISVDGSSGLSSYIPLDAGDGVPTAAFENIGTIGVESTITQIITTISKNTLDQPARIVLMQDGIELADAEATGGAEVLSFNILSDQISNNSLIYFKLNSTSTAGFLGITSIMTKVILTIK